MQDPYCYPNSRVLKNKLDIRDSEELHDAERNLSNLRNEELLHSPIRGRFDFTHLQKIHAYLFQDIYPWAGEIRTVDIAKGDLFCRYFAIASEADRIFTELKREKYLGGLDAGTFASRLAYYFAEINALHPFREGNGRTQREFIRQLAYQNNYCLSYAGITQDKMIFASKASFKLDYAPLEHLILTHLRPF
ncbi:MAG: Fic family protein [Candidatus Saccharibacteria bacterium]|nr:Fic family protein [Candidatus Saccharibacteria bacterium]